MANVLGVGELVKCRVWCNTAAGNGQASVNTIWFTVAATGSPPATDQDVADTLDGLIHAQMKGLLSAIATYRGVQAQIYSSVTPYLAFFVDVFQNANAGAGTVAGNILPPQSCGLISFSTARSGAGFRGRWYQPFPGAADDSGGGSPSAGYITRLAALAGNVSIGLAPAIGGRTATLVRAIVHGKNKGGVIPPPTPVVGASASSNWATQRRRGDFGRQNKSPI